MDNLNLVDVWALFYNRISDNPNDFNNFQTELTYGDPSNSEYVLECLISTQSNIINEYLKEFSELYSKIWTEKYKDMTTFLNMRHPSYLAFKFIKHESELGIFERCPKCNSKDIVKQGKTKQNKQKYQCKDCKKYF